MKKLLCLMLAFAMLFTSIAASAAIPTSKIPDFLNKTGVLESGSYADEARVITRGEFAQMISKLVAIGNIKNLSDVQIFHDIPMDSELFEVTTFLNKLYFIVGDGNGYFEPDALLTAEAACKIMVHLLGDQYFAQYNGGYFPAASNKGLLKHVEFTDDGLVTVKAAMRLIYNTMVADISNSNLYDGNAADDAEFEMFMSRRLGIYKIEGTVTDDGTTGLSGDTVVKEDQIKIGEYVFTDTTGVQDILGCKVEAFYRHNKDTLENTIIYIYVKEGTAGNENLVIEEGSTVTQIASNIIELKPEYINRYNNYTYEYYADEDLSDLDEYYLNTNFRLIYNGRAYTKDTAEDTFTKPVEEMLVPESGWVRLMDTDSDGYYDLITVKSYETIVLSSVDVENYVVYADSKYTSSKNWVIDLDGSENDMTIKNAVGSSFDFDSLDRGDVLSIAESADGKRVEIMYSNAKIEGTLGSTDGEQLWIGENAYDVTKDFADYMKKKKQEGGNAIVPGVYGTFYLTFDGKIAYFRDASETSIKVGLLGNAYCKSAMDDELSFLILTDTSSFDQLKAAKKVNVDGVIWKDMAQLKLYMDQFKYGLIRYRLNKENEINWIDTPYDEAKGNPNAATESDDTLHIMDGANDTSMYWNKNSQSFDGKFIMGENVTPFVYYPNEDFDKAYATTYANMSSNAARRFTAYQVDTETMYIDYIVYKMTKHGGDVYIERPTTAVVLKVSDAIDDMGEPVKKLLVTTNGTHLTDIIAEYDALTCKCGKGDCEIKPLQVGAGDVIQYSTTDGVINETIICYDYDGAGYVTPGNSYYFGEFTNGAFSGAGHDWENTNLWTKSLSGRTDYGSRNSRISVLPLNYMNRIEGTIAEFAFGIWPFHEYITVSGEGKVDVDTESQEEVLKQYSLSTMYAIRVNVNGGTFTPVKVADIKTYNNGDGVKEPGIMIWDTGKPTLLVYYK